jgi:hypothetical protein
MKKISFDFDSTLSRTDVQEFAKSLISEGFDVWIVTSRFDDNTAEEKNWWWIKKNNKELYDIAESCGIKKENIIFTQMIDKIEFLKDKGFLFHLDDDELEIEFIKESGDSCEGIWVELKDWKEKCKKMIA